MASMRSIQNINIYIPSVFITLTDQEIVYMFENLYQYFKIKNIMHVPHRPQYEYRNARSMYKSVYIYVEKWYSTPNSIDLYNNLVSYGTARVPEPNGGGRYMVIYPGFERQQLQQQQQQQQFQSQQQQQFQSQQKQQKQQKQPKQQKQQPQPQPQPQFEEHTGNETKMATIKEEIWEYIEAKMKERLPQLISDAFSKVEKEPDTDIENRNTTSPNSVTHSDEHMEILMRFGCLPVSVINEINE